jgi:hypothetical protein
MKSRRRVNLIVRRFTSLVTMIRSPHARVACIALALALALVACSQSNQSVTPRERSPLTPVAQEIQRRGYQVKETYILPPTHWEVSTFRMRSKRSFSFRANEPQAERRDHFVRFWFFEETYDSIDGARNRLVNLHLPSPDADVAVNEYDRVMRSGFRVGAVIYFLQTDAIVFWDEVKQIAKELFDSTPAAEQLTL